MKHRFHVVAFPHTKTNKSYGSCAYTQKLLRFCKMMLNAGHTVFHYGNEDSDVECTEHVQIYSTEDQNFYFGHLSWYKNQEWFGVHWDAAAPAWSDFNTRCAAAISKRATATDFICLLGGRAQASIAYGVPTVKAVEYGIGYEGIFTPLRVFESYAWMHHIYGLNQIKDGSAYDAVIPNFFDPEDFTFQSQPHGHHTEVDALDPRDYEPYALFMSRMINRKGYDIACEATKRAGINLIIAGSGGEPIPPDMDHVKHVGYANVRQRSALMGHAVALLCPTKYIEPFGGVTIEANFTGTPVITSDWGAFTETVVHGATGFRCRTLEHFVWGLKNLNQLSRYDCQRWAMDNYTLDRIALMYEEYFDMVHQLRFDAWYSTNHNRTDLDWLSKLYPP